MDTALSLVSSIEEIKRANSGLAFRELLVSGLSVGRDMIGTMTNILILSFAGSSLTLLLALI